MKILLIIVIVLFVGTLLLLARSAYRRSLRIRNRLQMDRIFTNISHELLTPLTVIFDPNILSIATGIEEHDVGILPPVGYFSIGRTHERRGASFCPGLCTHQLKHRPHGASASGDSGDQ